MKRRCIGLYQRANWEAQNRGGKAKPHKFDDFASPFISGVRSRVAVSRQLKRSLAFTTGASLASFWVENEFLRGSEAEEDIDYSQ
jgi:hypothetical protein